jgi:hypothetical protein
MKIVLRDEARKLGLKRFYTGVPCKAASHLSERYTASGSCIACSQTPEKLAKLKERNARVYADPVKRAERLEYERAKRSNPEFLAHRKQYMKDYYERPGMKEKQAAYMRDWNPANRSKKNEYQLRRTLAESLATPIWANVDAIVQFYKDRPEGYHVDHMIPLQGEIVCGLNVRSNLQYLTVSDNCSKGNSFDPNDPQWQCIRSEEDM